MFWVAEIIIYTKKIILIDYQKQNFILILVQLIIVKLLIFFSLHFFGVLYCSYITFMIVPIINKNIITKYITHYQISLNCKIFFNKTTIKIIITRNARIHG